MARRLSSIIGGGGAGVPTIGAAGSARASRGGGDGGGQQISAGEKRPPPAERSRLDELDELEVELDAGIGRHESREATLAVRKRGGDFYPGTRANAGSNRETEDCRQTFG